MPVPCSLALTLVPGLGRGLGGLPPRTVLRVPLDRLREARLEVRVLRRPAELGAQLGRVDRVTAVVARTVLHPIERVLVLPHHPQDHAQHGDVVLLAVRADQIRLADTALRQDRPHAAGMVLRMDPVAHVLAIAIQLRAKTLEDIRDLARDELLHVLVRAVVVRAVGDGGADAERAVPCAHQQVRAGLRRAVRAGRMVRGPLRELGRIIQGQVAVHLVRAHVVVAHIVLAGRLQQAERALHIRLQERLRVRDRVVVVGFRRVVHDRVMPWHQTIQQLRVADVPMHELHTVAQDRTDVLQVARIRQRIQHRHMNIGMIVIHVMNEIRTDETTATGHNDVMRSKHLISHALLSYKGVGTPWKRPVGWAYSAMPL